MKRTLIFISLVLLCVTGYFAWQHFASTSSANANLAASRAAVSPAAAQINAAYGSLPLSFEANRGQTDTRVQFLSRGNGYNLFLTPREAVLSLTPPAAAPVNAKSAVVRMRLVGANPSPKVTGTEELAGKSAYFIGGDPSRWHTDIPNYARVQYRDVFPGVDLVYYGHQGRLEYDFVLAPGADPSRIRLAFRGAQKLRLDKGDVVLNIPGGDVRLHQPLLYQERAGQKTAIEGHFILASQREVAFQVGAYDKSAALVIDPSLIYSTYLGGSNLEKALGIAADSKGNAYVTGSSASANFPTTAGALQTKARSADTTAFVAKLNPTGTALVYSTYLGGSNSDLGRAIAVNEKGEAFVAGATYSSDFPTTAGAAQSIPGGGRDAFVAKLSADGSHLLYATYLGGSGDEEARGLALNAAGEAHVAGVTQSANFPTTLQAAQRTANCVAAQPCHHAFVSKLSANGSNLLYSTFVGGSGHDFANAIALDASGAAYVAGHTFSADFPVTAKGLQMRASGHAACAAAGRECADAFVTKLSTRGTLLYSSILGGNGDQRANAIAVDIAGGAYITGRTDAVDFPSTPHALITRVPNHGGVGFVSKISPLGSALEYSTYLGGGAGDEGMAISVDDAGSAFVAGSTASHTFPTTAGALQRSLAGTSAAFLSRLNQQGSTLVYSTLLSGSGADAANAIALDHDGNVYVAGNTESKNFPLKHALHGTLDGQGSAFVAKFSTVPLVGTGSLTPASLNYATPFGTTSAPQSSTLKNVGTTSMTISGIALAGTNPGDFAFVSPAPAGACTSTTVLAANATCTINLVFKPTTFGGRNANVTITSNANNSPELLGLSGQGTGSFVTLAPTSLTFLNQTPATASPAQTVTLTNNGTASLTGISITVTGTNATDFKVTTTPATNCGGSVAAGSSCTLSVVFTPGATGVRVATVSIADSAFNTPQTIPLTGNPPVAKLTPTTLTFASTPQGTVARYQTVTLSNTGKFAPLSLTSISLGTGITNFQQANNCPIGGTLAPLASCSITAAFAPQGLNALTATLTVTDNSGNIAGSKQTAKLNGTATAAPVSVVSKTALTFGSVLQANPPNSSAPQTVAITNKGSANLNVGISISGSHFTVVPAATTPCGNGFNTVLTPGATCNAAVTFTPNSNVLTTGDRDALLVISTNSGNANSQNLVTLRGTATGIATATLCVSGSSPCATSFTFATPVVQNNPVNASPLQNLTLTNTGNIPLTLQNQFFNSGQDFQIGVPATNKCTNGQVLLPASNCIIAIQFAPSLTRVTGPRSDFLHVQTTSNNTNFSETDLAVVGTAIGAGTASLSATSLTFPSTAIGNTSTKQTVVLTNNGQSPLILQNIFFQGSDFQKPTPASNGCQLGGAGMPAGTSCNIDIQFAPLGTTSGSTRTDVLEIVDFDSNVPNSIQEVAVNGVATGVAPTLTVGMSPAGLNFGNQQVNTLSNPQTITVTNTNTTNMNIQVGPGQPSIFSVGGTCTGTIAPAATCNILVSFTPTALGKIADILFINTQISGAATNQRLPLNGTGTGNVSFSPSPTSLVFGNTLAGGISPAQSITLTNNGTVAIAFNNIFTAFSEIFQGSNFDYQEIDTCHAGSGIKLPPGASCTIDVFFTPLSTDLPGTRTGNLVVQELVNGVVNTLQVVPLTGTTVGVPALTLGPATGLSFIDQSINQAGSPQMYTLSNTGTAPLTIVTWGTTADFNPSFVFSTCPSTLPPGGTCNAFVTFQPSDSGLRVGFLFVETNTNNTPSFQSLPLTAFGTP